VVGVVGLAAVVLGGIFGLLRTDDGPSAAFLPSVPAQGQPTPPPATPDRSAPPAPQTAGGPGESIEWLPTTVATPPAAGPPGIGPPTPGASPPNQPGDVTTAGETSWADVLGGLDATRSAAFGRGDVALLASVYVTGSRPLERDRTALLELAHADVRAVGLRLVVDEVTVIRTAEDEVVLRVVDRMSGYRLVRADGSVDEVRAGRGPAAWLVTLGTGTGDGEWRIAAISAD